MPNLIYDKAVEIVRALSPADQERLLAMLQDEISRPKPVKSLEQIVAAQEVKPVDFELLLKTGEFFPEEESVDDFNRFLQEARQEQMEEIGREVS